MLVARDNCGAFVLALGVALGWSFVVALLLVAGGAVMCAIVRFVLLAVLVWGYARQRSRITAGTTLLALDAARHGEGVEMGHMRR